MPSKRDYKQALAYAKAQRERPSRSWEGYCQMFVRKAYGIDSLYGSAIAQWYGLASGDKHAGGHPDDAPVGSALFFAGGKYGHVMLAGGPFKNGTKGAWSNDLVRLGKIDKVRRTAPITAWGHRYLGYGTAINGIDLRYKTPPLKTPPLKKYISIAQAVDRMEAALERAVKDGDKSDIKVLKAEIKHLKHLHDTLRKGD